MEFLAVLLPFLFFSVYFLRKLKIPTIVGYIGVGVVLAYFFPFILNSNELKELLFFKQLAIAILFFFIGLEFPYKQILESLKSYKLAIIDFVINFTAIFLVSLLFLPLKEALLISLVLYLSLIHI
jgi:Kef-type K+ transport system membrane component KefB